MITKSQKNLTNNSLLKLSALLFGYAFWLVLAQQQTIQISPNVPLSFYLPETNLQIIAPSELKLGLMGKRLDLQKLDFLNIGAQIDASNLTKPGIYELEVASEHIFLPSNVKLLYYTPVIVNLELK